MAETGRRAERPPAMGGRPGGPMGGRPGGPFGMMAGPAPKLKNARGTLARLLGYLGEKKIKLAVVFLFTAAATALTIVGTRMNGAIIDTSIARGDISGLASSCALLAGLYLLGVVSTQVQNYLMIDVSQGTVAKLRRDLFHHMQGLPVRFFDRNTHGDLMSRFVNDVENINMTLSQSVAQFFGNVISIVGTLAAMLLLSPVMTLVSVATVPVMMAATRLIVRRTRKYYTEQQDTLGELNGYIEETVTGQRVVKVFNREEKVKAVFAEINGRLNKAGVRAQIFTGIIGPLMNMINNLTYAIVTAFGAWMILSGNGITVGIVFSFLLYMRQFGRPVNEIASLFNTIQSALAGAERIFGVMDEPREEADDPGAPALSCIRGEVAARDVSFCYLPGRPVLKHASFTAEPGMTIALVGPTGAGKTTVVNLFTRFYDVDSGMISIDGLDIRRVKRDSLRAALGIVLQDTCLFSETVRENIRYGRLAATDAEVEAAARMANAEPFILRLPQGYGTVLGDDGGNLSQGQRQLLSIARAILADPSILILDEATSSVDTRTELHIQQAMLELMKGRTSFVIAHRLSTIRNADLILVIDGGEIIERGTHEELMNLGGFYAGLLNSQRKTGIPNE
jgi:ATP-binding cassette subfamily B multidrug efflux pump